MKKTKVFLLIMIVIVATVLVGLLVMMNMGIIPTIFDKKEGVERKQEAFKC